MLLRQVFPRDVIALAKMTKGTPLGTLLEHLRELNVLFVGGGTSFIRDFHVKIILNNNNPW